MKTKRIVKTEKVTVPVAGDWEVQSLAMK